MEYVFLSPPFYPDLLKFNHEKCGQKRLLLVVIRVWNTYNKVALVRLLRYCK